MAYLSKGGEVGEVGKLTGTDRMQDRMLDLHVRSVLVKWRGLSLVDRTLKVKLTGLGAQRSIAH